MSNTWPHPVAAVVAAAAVAIFGQSQAQLDSKLCKFCDQKPMDLPMDLPVLPLAVQCASAECL
jgi:hypothetical protein